MIVCMETNTTNGETRIKEIGDEEEQDENGRKN